MAKAIPISQMTKNHLEQLLTFYGVDKPRKAKDMRAAFQKYLAQMNYKGKRNFSHLMKPETKELIMNANQSAVRPIGTLQNILIYNPEEELNEVLNEPDRTEEYFLLSPPCDSEAFNTCLREVNAQYPQGITSRYTEPTEPAPEYYFNQVQSLDDFHKLINHVVDSEYGIIKMT
jgi:hypothetical protein